MYNSSVYLKIFMYSLIKQSFAECESSIMLGRRYSKMKMAWFSFPVSGLQTNLNYNSFPIAVHACEEQMASGAQHRHPA